VDFELDESLRELRGLAAELLGREVTADRLAEHERGGGAFDTATWRAMAGSGLIGCCLPEDIGGAGAGALGLAVLLREMGARVAPVPLYPTVALGGLPVAAHGTAAQRKLLGRHVDAGRVLTAAIREPDGIDPADPRALARRAGDGYVLDGVKIAVPYAREAAWILVPARVEGAGVGVFMVAPAAPPAAAGHGRGAAITTYPASTGEPLARIDLTGLRVGADDLVGGAAAGRAAATLRRYALAGAAATVSGVLAGALELTTEHVKTREQFGRPLAAFQAVTMQISDVYIAKRTLDVAMWAAVWRLAEDGPGTAFATGVADGTDGAGETDERLALAAYVLCGRALEALHTCQHLHGGVGLDVTYPLHRFFGWAKHYAHLLGGAEAQLETIGGLVCSST
jgi:alkylation response protein AidB-like acyl-CoA dehydrogenase